MDKYLKNKLFNNNVNDRGLGRNIETIGVSIYAAFQDIPKKIFGIIGGFLLFFSTFLTIISSTFDYHKPKFIDSVNSINWTYIIFFILLILFLFLAYLLISGFSKYISENDYKVNFVTTQMSQRPLLLNNNIMRDFILEVENCCILKKNLPMVDEYFYVLEINLIDENTIEITAKNKQFPIYERMTFELLRKKSLDDIYVYDPEGLVVVCRKSPESFTSILIDTHPRESQWRDTMKELKNTRRVKPSDLYLKTYIPTIVKQSTEEDLTQILEGIKRI